MSLPYHQLSRMAFLALAGGGGGSDVIRELAAAQYSKHVLLLRGVLAAAQDSGRDQALRAGRAYDLLAAVQRQAPGAAQAVIGHPAVGAWALRTVRACRGGPAMPGADPGGLSAVAAAAAVRAGLPADIEVTAVGEAVMLPSLGAARLGGGSAVLRADRGAAELTSGRQRVRLPADPHQDGPGWLALRRIRVGSLDALIDDVDQFRMPAVSDVAVRLDDAELRELDAVFQATWPLLLRDHPAIADEAAAAIRVIVPLTRPPEGERSSSSSETFGAIALSQPRDVSTLAVTMTHEVQHLKLCALIDLVGLVRPDDGQRYYAPWRDDPRPVSGLLQGAYAYLGVSGFWRQQRRVALGAAGIRAHAEFARWRAAAALVTSTLAASGQLTAAGAEFVRGMARTLHAWRDEHVPDEARRLARQEADEHRARWVLANGPIPS